MKVYLAGGMRSGWQDEVKRAVDADFVDPRQDMEASEDDLRSKGWEESTAIALCDLMFAYLEEDNPEAVGIWCEMTLARCLGQRVIFVDGWTEEQRKHMSAEWVPGFLRMPHSDRFHCLADGIEALRRAVREPARTPGASP